MSHLENVKNGSTGELRHNIVLKPTFIWLYCGRKWCLQFYTRALSSFQTLSQSFKHTVSSRKFCIWQVLQFSKTDNLTIEPIFHGHWPGVQSWGSRQNFSQNFSLMLPFHSSHMIPSLFMCASEFNTMNFSEQRLSERGPFSPCFDSFIACRPSSWQLTLIRPWAWPFGAGVNTFSFRDGPKHVGHTFPLNHTEPYAQREDFAKQRSAFGTNKVSSWPVRAGGTLALVQMLRKMNLSFNICFVYFSVRQKLIFNKPSHSAGALKIFVEGSCFSKVSWSSFAQQINCTGR